ncbi:MAG: acyl-CoA dehydratase activase-related protein [Actinomycetota bacterium]|nr:acyl-CoA dehydratase activase-related protein [Actinomycetota bacterium]
MADAIRIGLPRSMLYHKYHVLWSTFFEELGCETVVSPPTNKWLLERGASLAVDESCLSMKIFLGHVEALRGRADYVLVPAIASLYPREDACVKLMGAYDIARHSVEGVSLITYVVDEQRGISEKREMLRLGRKFCRNPLRVRAAYHRARLNLRAHERELAREQQSLVDAPRDRLRILIVGHAYNLADEFIGAPIKRYLESLDVTVLDSEALDHEVARSLYAHISTDVKWTYNKQLLGAVEYYRDKVDGMIFLVAFPCGPDSLMVELCQRRVKDVPIAILVLDELSSETGLRTRMESFVDILMMGRAADGRSAAPQGEPEAIRGTA